MTNDGTPGGTEHPPASEPTDEPWYEHDQSVVEDRPPRRLSNGRIALFVGAAILAVIAVIAAILLSGEDPTPASPSTTASSTTTPAVRPAEEATIATARNP